MEAELFGENKNGDFALTVARLALLTCRGGRGEDGAAAGLDGGGNGAVERALGNGRAMR